MLESVIFWVIALWVPPTGVPPTPAPPMSKALIALPSKALIALPPPPIPDPYVPFTFPFPPTMDLIEDFAFLLYLALVSVEMVRYARYIWHGK